MARTARRFCINRGSRRNRFGRATRWLIPAWPTSGGAYSMRAIGRQVCTQGLRQSQRTIEVRTNTSTWAPTSCSRAADSSALCPPPITATCFPLKRLRSVCAEACEAKEPGRDLNSGGCQAKGMIPAATTTRRAFKLSPSSRLRWNPDPFFSTRSTFRESRSGTAWF